MARFFILMVLAPVVLAACTQLPPIDAERQARLDNATYPEFVDVDQIPEPRTIDRPAIEADISTRLARVDRRARQVRGPVLTSGERARLRSRRAIVRGQVLTDAERTRLGTVLR